MGKSARVDRRQQLDPAYRADLAPVGAPVAMAPTAPVASDVAAPVFVPQPAPGQVMAPQQATQQVVNVNVVAPSYAAGPGAYGAAAAPPVVVLTRQGGPGFLVRAVWWLFVGWWASAVAIVLGYLAFVTVIGIPLGLAILHRVPQIATLRARTEEWTVRHQGGIAFVGAARLAQRPWLLRAAYFLLVGWWFAAVWLVLSWALTILILPMPLGVWMINRANAVLTLERH